MEVAGRRKEEDSDDHTTGILCDPCRRENDDENAVFYCTVCNEFLCDADAKAHRKAAMLKSHKLLDRNNMPRQKIGTFADNLCSFHEGEILKYYCSTHNKNCCSVCTTKEHKQCNVEYIDDIAKGYEQSSEYKSLIKDMTDLMRQLESVKQQSVDNKNNFQSLRCEIISEFRKSRAECNSILDSLESASLEEVNGTLHVDSDAADTTTTNCDILMARLQEMTSFLNNLKTYKQERQLVMHSKNARAQVKDIKDKISKLSAIKKMKEYKYIPDKTIPQLLRSYDSLGRFEITEESTKTKGNDQRAKEVFGADISVPVLNQPVNASHLRDINIKHSRDTDTDCWISGGVMLDRTELALVDRNNASVKVVDVISNTVTSCKKLPSTPWDITSVEQDQVVVSGGGSKLVFLKVDKAVYIVKQLDLKGDMRGIVYTNHLLLVGFHYPEPCVKVLNLMGKTLKTFKTDSDGNNLFRNPWFIAISKDQNTIFVSDSDYERVTSLLMDGTVRGVYTDDNLRGPRCLTVDRNDNVYVAGYWSNNIHQLSADCKPIRVLLDTTHGIEYPWMVTYCKTEHKLYIGYDATSKKSYISVFQLQ